MDCYPAWFVVISLIYSAQGQSTWIINTLPAASQSSSTLSSHNSVHASSPSITQTIAPNITLVRTTSTKSQSVKSTPSPSSHKQESSTAVIASSVNASSPSSNISTTITPNKTKSISPNMTNTVNPNTTHGNPTMVTTHHSGTPVPPTETKVPSTHSMGPTTPGPTKSAGKNDDDYDSMKKRMWIAASFAIIFALTTVILAYLVYRQRKINRELEGDPASSRLL